MGFQRETDRTQVDQTLELGYAAVVLSLELMYGMGACFNLVHCPRLVRSKIINVESSCCEVSYWLLPKKKKRGVLLACSAVRVRTCYVRLDLVCFVKNSERHIDTKLLSFNPP